MTKKTKLIVVDFDGPINNLLSAKKKTIVELCKKFHISLSEETLGKFVNYIDHYYIHNRPGNYKELIRQCLNRLNKDKQIICKPNEINHFSDLFLTNLLNHLQPNKIILSALSKTKKAFPKIKICIYTSQTSQYVEHFFEINQLDLSQFTKVYGNDFFTEPKPSIKNLEAICQEQCVTFDEALMISDDPTQDLLPAHILGMKTALFNSVVHSQIKDESDLIHIIG